MKRLLILVVVFGFLSCEKYVSQCGVVSDKGVNQTGYYLVQWIGNNQYNIPVSKQVWDNTFVGSVYCR